MEQRIIALAASSINKPDTCFLDQPEARVLSIPFLGITPFGSIVAKFRSHALLAMFSGIQRKFVVTSDGMYETQKAVPSVPRSWIIDQTMHAGRHLC